MDNMLLLISVLYGITGIMYGVLVLHRIIKTNRIKIFDFVCLMYTFVYGFVPCLIYAQEAGGARDILFYDYSTEGIVNIFAMLFLSVAAYGAMNLAYYVVPAKRKLVKSGIPSETEKENIAKHLMIGGTAALLIGGISLLLWTRAYGSLSNFILNATAIRSGRGSVHNSFAFMKQFTRIMPLSLYALIASGLYKKETGVRYIEYLILLALAVLGNYLYFLASDSRMTIIFIGLAVLGIVLKHRKKKRIAPYLVGAAVAAFLLLDATMLADTFTRFVRRGVWEANTNSVIENLTKEFRFILSSNAKVMKVWSEENLHWKILDDVINALFSWLPDRFIPFKLPETVWAYNTSLYGTQGTGTLPSALVATGIYEIGILGALIHPFVFGLATAFVDKRMTLWDMSRYSDVYYGVCIGLFVQMVSHNQMYTFTLSLFPAFLFFVVTKIIDNVSFAGKKLVRDKSE